MAKQYLTDAEVLAKYEIEDPGTDALRFALMVNEIAVKRRSYLSGLISYKEGELVRLRYKITGFDSQQQAITLIRETGASVLADTLRELNKRYAAHMQAVRDSQS